MMNKITVEDLTRMYKHEPKIAKYDDKETLDYVESKYFVRRSLTFYSWTNTLNNNKPVIWSSIGDSDSLNVESMNWYIYKLQTQVAEKDLVIDYLGLNDQRIGEAYKEVMKMMNRQPETD